MLRHFDLVVCTDGFKVSVQADEYHYCSPRNDVGPWTAVELGFPSSADDLIAEYAEDESDLTGTVYSHVPITTVQALVEKHGGIDIAAMLNASAAHRKMNLKGIS